MTTIDGRTARAIRTRDVIVDACIGLVDEGDLRPTAPKVAERAGVSVRSVFQHFADVEGLYAAVGDRVADRLQSLVLVVDPDDPIEVRLPEVVRQRSDLLEAVTPILRATAVHAWGSVEVDNRVRSDPRSRRRTATAGCCSTPLTPPSRGRCGSTCAPPACTMSKGRARS
jgi:AcrR family transcriptional regulator